MFIPKGPAPRIDPRGPENRALWLKKGLFVGLDGTLKAEISDRDLVLKGMAGSLDQVVQHPDLLKEVPGLRKAVAQVGLAASPQSGGATTVLSQSPLLQRIEARGPDVESLKDEVAHELQHPVNNLLGGGSGQDLGGSYSQNLAEMEADVTKKRRTLTAAQRRARFPLDDYPPEAFQTRAAGVIPTVPERLP